MLLPLQLRACLQPWSVMLLLVSLLFVLHVLLLRLHLLVGLRGVMNMARGEDVASYTDTCTLRALPFPHCEHVFQFFRDTAREIGQRAQVLFLYLTRPLRVRYICAMQ